MTTALPRPGLVAAIGGAMGALAFVAVFGTAILNPAFDEWMTSRIGDPAASYVGWLYFRSTPWHFPPGVITEYLTPFGTSVVFTDSIPLVALPLKAIAGWLPEPFQYFGLWALATYILQGAFAAILLKRFIGSNLLVLLGTGFFVLSEPMLIRTGGHAALGGHFVILAAMCVWAYADGFRSRRSVVTAWAAVCSAAVLIHPYFAVMVGVLFGGFVVRDFLTPATLRRPLAARLALFVFPILFTAFSFWMAGGFRNAGSQLDGGNLGHAGLNLTALFSPGSPSPFLPELPDAPIHFPGEGEQYLGFGLILLAPLSLLLLFWRRMTRPAPSTAPIRYAGAIPYALVVVVLLLIAVGPDVYWNDQLLWKWPLPKPVLGALGAFQSSGRLFWPVFYGVMFLLIVGACRLIRSRAAGAAVLSLALAIQFVDLQLLLEQLHEGFARDRSIGSDRGLQSPFWNHALTRMKRAEFIYTHDLVQPLRLAIKAAPRGMSMNAGYAARIPMEQTAGRSVEVLDRVLGGELDAATMYVMQDRYALFRVLSTLDPKAYELRDAEGYLLVTRPGALGAADQTWPDVRPIPVEPVTIAGYIDSLSKSSQPVVAVLTSYTDGFTGLTPDDAAALRAIGLKTDPLSVGERSYAAVVSMPARTVLAEQIANDTLKLTIRVGAESQDREPAGVEVISRGASAGRGGWNWFDVVSKVNGEALWPVINGLNVQVFDANTGTLLDIAWFSAEAGFKGRRVRYPYAPR